MYEDGSILELILKIIFLLIICAGLVAIGLSIYYLDFYFLVIGFLLFLAGFFFKKEFHLKFRKDV
ncbi:hypothetical protein F4V57_11075 [Acinetobacter qingfengensis]|uniref:Uncharacterized protein n=1 Tax=Acinetobacter qingfengensis TaxID=1262585 RepID=A0A1E7RD18_9GAMM|nr:hypothetical protein [Acinetobacter qingfengensis]KAA8732152.1 hypothetical protein F4V57_11075 [Acinetobacter qingfengensis]OEY97231.1 hypothetical protein BJI46_02060 [Acinetobacter qingfengensis]